jgi:hypothetical protein
MQNLPVGQGGTGRRFALDTVPWKAKETRMADKVRSVRQEQRSLSAELRA